MYIVQDFIKITISLQKSEKFVIKTILFYRYRWQDILLFFHLTSSSTIKSSRIECISFKRAGNDQRWPLVLRTHICKIIFYHFTTIKYHCMFFDPLVEVAGVCVDHDTPWYWWLLPRYDSDLYVILYYQGATRVTPGTKITN